MYAENVFPVLLALIPFVYAHAQKGFNYGSTNANASCLHYDDFTNMFHRQRHLHGAPGFDSVRLYTTIQCGSIDTPIEALQAAIDNNMTVLMGLWASAGQDSFNNEVAALVHAADRHGKTLSSQVVGISVGSEDLYRASAPGNGAGASAADIVRYINQVRGALRGTALENVKIGHVDTSNVWFAPENAPVIKASDFIGVNSFPYWAGNAIEDARSDFVASLDSFDGITHDKPVWITETGWAVRGPQQGSALASEENAKTYWGDVGCQMFDDRNVWWYTLFDSDASQTELSFAVVWPDVKDGQKFDLSCPAKDGDD